MSVLPIDINSNSHRKDVSDRALAIARQIDQLPRGVFNIRLDKMNEDRERWDVKIEGVVEVKSFQPYEKPTDSLPQS